MNNLKLAIIVPCYNEEEVLQEAIKQLTNKLNSLIQNQSLSDNSFICFIDDGSDDRTWELITEFSKKNKFVKALKLSRNRGHQNALLAGLEKCHSLCDVTISIDADLQDDIGVMDKFIEKYKEGYEVVYGVRKNRDKDSAFKKFTALFFYKLMLSMGVDLIYNHADYRLVSSKALKALQGFREVNLFLRGIFPQIGFPYAKVEYDREARFAGESKYPLKKMISFALEGITSFSTTPLRIVTGLGLITVCLTVLLLTWAFIQSLLGNVIPGWSSTIISIYFLGGVQLLSIGLIGEYIGKIYKEVKARPRYIIATEVCFSEIGPSKK